MMSEYLISGIGSDDAFIFCKTWETQKLNQDGSLEQIMTDTFHHAFMTMFITSLTTAVAFLGSSISAVTAVACFRYNIILYKYFTKELLCSISLFIVSLSYLL